MEKLKNFLKSAPSKPGVYHFLDENGLILYVGKAKNIKNRLTQYMQKELNRGPAIVQMVGMAATIEWTETESEIEAVILEAEQIRKLKPKYNVKLKDDKSFLAIKIAKKVPISKSQNSNRITTSKFKISDKSGQLVVESPDQFPCVELVRFKNVDLSDKSADYFGPYPSGDLLRKSLNYLRKIFPFRDCSKTKFNTWRRKGRTCIFGDIRVCSGPCNAWVNQSQYNKNIMMFKKFLRGKKREIISKLEKEMNTLSKRRRYEEAALVRNKLLALEHIKDVALGFRDDVFNSETGVFDRIECYDISNLGDKYSVGSMVVFEKGKPETSEYRKFKIRRESDDELTNDLSRLRQVLERRFTNAWTKPDLIVIDGGEMQLKVAAAVIKNLKLDIPLISISKGPKRQKNDFHFADGNVARYFLNNDKLKNTAIAARDEAHRFAIAYYRKLHKQAIFD